METEKVFRDALRSGKTVYGTLITSSSPRIFDTVTSLRPDFVFLCTEHIFYNPDSLGWMCRAYKAAGIVPLVRILKPDPSLASQAIDSGASAILVPYAEDPEQIEDIVGAVKFRPLKGKKLKNIQKGIEKPTPELRDYLRKMNSKNSLLLNIESPEGVRNMDRFLEIESPDGPGVDGFVIGPHDLSVSFDIPEKYNSREFIDISSDIIKKARAGGRAAGGHNGSRSSTEIQIKWAEAGASIIIHSSDVFLFADKYHEDINMIRKIKGEKNLDTIKNDNV